MVYGYHGIFCISGNFTLSVYNVLYKADELQIFRLCAPCGQMIYFWKYRYYGAFLLSVHIEDMYKSLKIKYKSNFT